jgi:hypothetical protein
MRFERRHPSRALWPLLLLFVAIGGGWWVLMPGPPSAAGWGAMGLGVTAPGSSPR